MRVLLITLGVIDIFIFGALLVFYITLLRKGERHTAEIIEISEGYSFGKSVYRYTPRVRFTYQGSECEVETLTALTSFFFSRRKVMRFRARYVGKKIHIAYHPQKPSQTLIVEWVWKDFLFCTVWILVGLFILLAGILGWF